MDAVDAHPLKLACLIGPFFLTVIAHVFLITICRTWHIHIRQYIHTRFAYGALRCLWIRTKQSSKQWSDSESEMSISELRTLHENVWAAAVQWIRRTMHRQSRRKFRGSYVGLPLRISKGYLSYSYIEFAVYFTSWQDNQIFFQLNGWHLIFSYASLENILSYDRMGGLQFMQFMCPAFMACMCNTIFASNCNTKQWCVLFSIWSTTSFPIHPSVCLSCVSQTNYWIKHQLSTMTVGVTKHD